MKNHGDVSSRPTAPQALPSDLTSVQPGGGVCYQIELAWGRLRRTYLRRFRVGYIQRMAGLRRGSDGGAPHAILDPRDLKYCRNQCTADWSPEDDPFTWRERIPFARWGLAELQLIGYPLAALTVVLLALHGRTALPVAWLALAPGVVLGLVIYFFRDPPRRTPNEPGLLVAPADGKVVEIVELAHDDFIGGPAVRIGIFLSIFNVHLNRAPARARVIRLVYERGKFLSALKPASALENENLRIDLEEPAAPYRRLAVRQIAGQFARRIVCNLRSGELLEPGAKFGMIKLGSRTELILEKAADLRIETRLGERVRGGVSILARYDAPPDASRPQAS